MRRRPWPAVLALAALALVPARVSGAQPAAEAPRLHATMFHPVVTWSAEPGDGFEVTLRDSDGAEKAYVTAYTDASGRATATLHWRTHDFDYRGLAPGDRLVIARFQGPTVLDLVIPRLEADVTDDGGRVVGNAPPGARLALALEPRGGEPGFGTEAVADDGGRFEVELPTGASLAPGEGGRLTYEAPEGHEFEVRFARRRVELVLGVLRAETRSSLQVPVGVARPVDLGTRLVSRGLRRQDYNLVPARDGSRVLGDEEHYPPITAGTVVTVTQTGGPLGRADTLVRTMPNLAIQTRGTRLVAGYGLPGEALTVEVLAPDSREPAGRFTVTPDADGRFELALPESAVLAAGWRALVRQDLGAGILVRAEVAVPFLRMSVGAARIEGRLSPRQPYTVTLRGRDGLPRARTSDGTDTAGLLALQLDNGQRYPGGGWPMYQDLRPGDTVEVELVSGDPLRLTVPDLTATSDPDREVITGRAPPGAALDVVVHVGARVVQRRVLADLNGRYAVDLSGEVDLEPGVQSAVTWTEPGGHQFYVLTAPLGLVAPLGRTYMDISPYFGYAVTTTLSTAAGALAGRGGEVLGEIEGPGGLPVLVYPYNVWFTDRFDNGMRIEPGDVVDVRAGSDEARMTVPPLDARVHIEDDLVVGRTVPGAMVRIDVQSPANITATLRADAAGYFRHSFAGTHDLLYNLNPVVWAFTGRHGAVRHIDGPGLLLDLSAARLTGSMEPDVAVAVRLGPAANPRGQADGRANERAGFELILRDDAGEPVEPRAGEALAVTAPAAELTRAIDWVVPLLTLAVAPDDGVASGAADPEAQLRVERGPALGFPALPSGETAWPRLAADGAWQAADLGAWVPGTRTTVLATLPSGHLARRSVIHPIVNVQHGGGRVCGAGPPHAPVTVAARDAAGTRLAGAVGRASADGLFDLVLTDDRGAVFRTAAGQTVSAAIADEPLIEVPLGPFDVTFDPATEIIEGNVGFKATIEVFAPSRTCLFRTAPDVQDPYGVPIIVTGSSADGAVRRDVAGHGIAERTVDLAVYTTAGHRYYRRIHTPLHGEAYVGTDRLAGSAPPHQPAAIVLLGPDGHRRAEAAAVPGEDGRFEVRLTDANGAPARLSPGDRLVLASGDLTATLTVEPVSFDYSPEVGVQGTAPPGRTVSLRLDVPGRAPEFVPLTADAQGRFVLRASELSPRARWSFRDVTALRVSLPQPGGHASVAEWRAAAEDRGRTLYLPRLER